MKLCQIELLIFKNKIILKQLTIRGYDYLERHRVKKSPIIGELHVSD